MASGARNAGWAWRRSSVIPMLREHHHPSIKLLSAQTARSAISVAQFSAERSIARLRCLSSL